MNALVLMCNHFAKFLYDGHTSDNLRLNINTRLMINLKNVLMLIRVSSLRYL